MTPTPHISTEYQPFRINLPNQPQRLAPWLAASLENLLGFSLLNTLYAQVSNHTTPHDFLGAALNLLNIRVTVASDDFAKIPSSGPVVAVANHPFGVVEGMLLAHILLEVRSDVKVLANYFLEQIPQTRDLFIFVDPFATPRSAHANIRGLKAALNAIEQGQMLVIFPAGEVSHLDMRKGQVIDPAWSDTVARLIRRAGAPVLPAYFCGANGPLFQMAGLVHPRLRTMMLPRELLNKKNRTVEVRFGSLLSARHLQGFAGNDALTRYLRERTYALAVRKPQTYKPSLPFSALALPLPKAGQPAPIINAILPSRLQAEINQLPVAQMLVESNEFAVYYATADQAPQLLHEIGRLREVAFRGVGEGTNKAVDLDPFDHYYLHLFVWNRTNQEIVGAYRLGLTDEILRRYGPKGLYTSTLFHFAPHFWVQINPAIELGRSFVHPEYQRAYAPLLLLWRGIGQFVMRHPDHKRLFGPVSISNNYTDMSRELLVAFLRHQYPLPALASLVKPRNPPRRRLFSPWKPDDLGRLLNDVDDLSSVIQDIEQDQKGVPILIKQYLKMGARVLAFNVDRNFNHALDALVLADLSQTAVKVLSRYVEKAQAEAFLAYHKE